MSFFLVNIPVLLNVAFLTLLERKILRLIQIRKGPNKVGFIGLLQPFADAIKLFTKAFIIPKNRNKVLFVFSPVIDLSMALAIWVIIPFFRNNFYSMVSVFYFLIVLRLRIYPILLSGWSSNRKYAIKGAIRRISQTISYEISLAIVLITFLLATYRYNLRNILLNISYFSFFYFFPLFTLWFLICLIERNRTPFDFSEGESELVSGFNVEYSSYIFALIFIAEYAKILFFSAFSGLLFFGMINIGYFLSSLRILLLAILWIWLRGTFPRYRYDKLISFSWKTVLPITLSYLLFFFLPFS